MNVLLDGNNFHEEWAYDRFSQFIGLSTRVTVIPFAFHDDWVKDSHEWHKCYDPKLGKFYRGIAHPFLQFGVLEENITFVNYFENTVNELIDLLANTDIIYFVGGLPDKTMKRLAELNMIDLVNNFKGIIMGWSAGASMQTADYYIAPDNDYKEYSRQKGLNHIDDFAVQVHYTGAKEQIDSINKFKGDSGLRVFTLEINSGIIVDDNKKIELIGNARAYMS